MCLLLIRCLSKYNPQILQTQVDITGRWIRAHHNLIKVVVIDEVQAMLTGWDFRPVMKALDSLMSCKVPITGLTGTLPIRLEQKLKEALGLPQEHTMIRTRTARPEHQYCLLRCASQGLLSRTIAFICLLSSSFLKGNRRGIIFVRKKMTGSDICERFPQVDFIHGGIKDEEQRQAMLQKWRDGLSGGWIIGTTSLIQGVDYHDVHLVVFVMAPFSMVDFVQGAGRAGRSGESSKVILLHAGEGFGLSCGDESDDLSCQQEMASWVKSPLPCRRMGISQCMDGETLTCDSLPGAMPCDLCQPQHDLEKLWEQAAQLSINMGALTLENLSTCPLGLSPPEKPTQLPIFPLMPRLARPEVVKNSLRKLDLERARIQSAVDCIQLLRTFGENCGICHAESGGRIATGKRHMCIVDCKTRRSNFKDFYQHNKPGKVRGLFWDYITPLIAPFNSSGYMILPLERGATPARCRR